MSKKTFLFFLFTANTLFMSTGKKVDGIELDQESETVKKPITKNSSKQKQTESLDYDGGQTIFSINKDYIFQNSLKAKADKEKMNDEGSFTIKIESQNEGALKNLYHAHIFPSVDSCFCIL